MNQLACGKRTVIRFCIVFLYNGQATTCIELSKVSIKTGIIMFYTAHYILHDKPHEAFIGLMAQSYQMVDLKQFLFKLDLVLKT